jgi:hypothetical protein
MKTPLRFRRENRRPFDDATKPRGAALTKVNARIAFRLHTQ